MTGRNNEHRRGWLADKIKSLSDIFAIVICAYAIMHNHYHVVLRVIRKEQKVGLIEKLLSVGRSFFW